MTIKLQNRMVVIDKIGEDAQKKNNIFGYS